MALYLKQKAFLHAIKRKTPCLICIEDKNDAINCEIIKSVDNLCNEFPYVLCYKINIIDYEEYHLNKSIYGPHNLIRFEDEQITSVIDGNNYSEMYKLFWQVYFDACANNFEGYIKVLYAEKFITTYNRPMYNLEDLSFLEELEGGILSKILETKKLENCKPIFKRQRCSIRNSSRKENSITTKKKSFANDARNGKLIASNLPGFQKFKYFFKRNSSSSIINNINKNDSKNNLIISNEQSDFSKTFPINFDNKIVQYSQPIKKISFNTNNRSRNRNIKYSLK